MSDEQADMTATEVLIRQTIAPIDHGLKKLRAELEQYIEQQDGEPKLDALYSALSAAQGKIQAAEANQTADAGSYSYKYADLAACLEVIRNPLAENELCLIQIPSLIEGEVHIETILGHSSGQQISCSMSMHPDKGGAQAIGAVMTYLRRYSLSAMLGVAQYDDDAASATKGPEEYDRLSPRDIDEVLQKADELFAEKADFVIEQMVTLVFNVKHLADIPADQLKTALNRLKNTAEREAKKAADAKKSPVAKPKAKPKAKAEETDQDGLPPVARQEAEDREPGSDDDKGG